MESSNHKSNCSSSADDAQQIHSWLQRYVRHRQSGPFLLGIITFILFFVSIAGLSFLSGICHRNGNTIGFWVCTTLLAVIMLSLFVFSISRWGGRWIAKWGEQLYKKDGQVKAVQKVKPRFNRLGRIIGMLFGVCVLGSIFLDSKGVLPHDYMQPISVIFCVPFMIFLILNRPAIKSPVMWLWPILYTLHALAVVANIPPISLLPRRLDMVVAIGGYGLMTAAVSIIVNRYSLYRLKQIVRRPIEKRR